jgi:hypothetical protein
MALATVSTNTPVIILDDCARNIHGHILANVARRSTFGAFP